MFRHLVRLSGASLLALPILLGYAPQAPAGSIAEEGCQILHCDDDDPTCVEVSFVNGTENWAGEIGGTFQFDTTEEWAFSGALEGLATYLVDGKFTFASEVATIHGTLDATFDHQGVLGEYTGTFHMQIDGAHGAIVSQEIWRRKGDRQVLKVNYPRQCYVDPLVAWVTVLTP